MNTKNIDDFYEKLEGNNYLISNGLDPKIISVLNNSKNYMSLLINNQSIFFNVEGDTMYLYEIRAKGFGANLMLQIIKKAIDEGLKYIKLEADALDLYYNDPIYDSIQKYLFSFYSSFGFKRIGNTNYFTLDLDDEKLINILNNKFDLYLNTKKWIKL